MRRIIATVTVFDTPDLLPFFCEHYVRLGVDKILVAARTSADLSELVSRFGDKVIVRYFHKHMFYEHRKMYGEEQMLRDQKLDPDDWVMHLDLDEFHQYPANLRDICAIADAQHIWAIRGTLLDRIRPDGVMVPIDPNTPIDQQFTHTAWLTKHMVRDIACKIMLARRKVKIMGGRHRVANAKAARWPVGFHEQYLVHHFRWHGNLVERLLDRRKSKKRSQWFDRQIQAMREYQRNGKFDLSEPILELQLAKPLQYPPSTPAMKYLTKARSGFGLRGAELSCLLSVVKSKGIKSVLEFGPGVSTAVLAGANCKVKSLEPDPNHFAERKRQLEHQNIEVHYFQSGHPVVTSLAEASYDLGFITGPSCQQYSFISRVDAIQYAASRCRFLLLHDTKRAKEQRGIEYLKQSGWQVDQHFDTERGLTLLSQSQRITPIPARSASK